MIQRPHSALRALQRRQLLRVKKVGKAALKQPPKQQHGVFVVIQRQRFLQHFVQLGHRFIHFVHRMAHHGNTALAQPDDAAAYVKRIAKVDDLHWVRGRAVDTLIETLKKWAMRDHLPAAVAALRQGGETVVEDSKGFRDTSSAAYRLFVMKRKMMLYFHGITVREV